MKVAYLGNQLTSGGGATSLFLMLQSLREVSFEKYVWLTQISSESMRDQLREFCTEVELIELDDVTSCQTKRASEQHLEKARRLQTGIDGFIERLNQNEIDILHVNNSVFTHAYQRIKAETKVKLITHVREWITHSGQGPVEAFMLEQIQLHSDAIIVISPVEASMFDGSNKVHIMANPFDFEASDKLKNETVEGLKKAHKEVIVTMMGRPSLSKGHLQFLKVLSIILKEYEPKSAFKFAIIGLSPPKMNWRKWVKRILGREPYFEVMRSIRKLHLNHHVVVIPYLQNVYPLLQQTDIIVRPSLFADPWGRDIIEAFALNKPVVAFGQNDFYIKEGKSGYLIPDLNEALMAQRLSFLIDNLETREQFGEYGRQQIRAMCNLKDYAKRVLQVYETMFPKHDLNESGN